ncbi:MAG: RagB/SusD family nutrient uptake outer membrane protein [Candidatus Symbiothrix sp.]|nr:RagB/SusD family nutrient uptake outer membrane protein [Candidatus Symbiothrix sp.]
MKKINIKVMMGAFMLSLLSVACSDILEEQPRATYDPSFFTTKEGVESGLTSMYAHLRYIFGQGYYYNITLTGTDEYTWAASADANFKDADMTSGGTMTASSSRADVLWNAAFPNINTASGVIENAEAVGLAPSLIAEARFFRAFDYFYLVQTFGGVPLDLGAGNLKFNTSTVRVSTRNTVPEVYTIGIFPDLKQAILDLPDAPRIIGAATKTAARLYLAKAYLTYAWWLENPKNIPTYPEAPRTDPDGHPASWYYQEAYNVAADAITNPGPFKLMDTYYQVHVASNDRNNEILLFADHTNASQQYNGGIDFGYANGEAPDNFASWMVTPQMENLRSWDGKTYLKKVAPNETVDSLDTSGSKIPNYTVSSVPREAAQWGGRPWTRMAPPIGVFTNTFADKTNDSRYDGTFTSVFHANWQKNNSASVLYNANALPVYPGDNSVGAVGINRGLGDAILTFLPDETLSASILYPSADNKDNTNRNNSNVGAGVIPARADWVISPLGINRQYYPGLWKIGTYRTDNGNGLGTPNGSTCRPFDIAKFSELYLVAAEAAVKGATTKAVTGCDGTARGLVNMLRARAGIWRFSNAENTAKDEDNSAAMIAATPATIDINYILAERSREFFGEGYRWFDLVRTQKWEEIAGTYQIAEAGSHTPTIYTRNIKAFHYLRPIPQGQLDRLDMPDADVKAYQNPQY